MKERTGHLSNILHPNYLKNAPRSEIHIFGYNMSFGMHKSVSCKDAHSLQQIKRSEKDLIQDQSTEACLEGLYHISDNEQTYDKSLNSD